MALKGKINLLLARAMIVRAIIEQAFC